MSKKDVRPRRELTPKGRKFASRAGKVWLVISMALLIALGLTGELTFLISGVMAGAAGIGFTKWSRRM